MFFYSRLCIKHMCEERMEARQRHIVKCTWHPNELEAIRFSRLDLKAATLVHYKERWKQDVVKCTWHPNKLKAIISNRLGLKAATPDHYNHEANAFKLLSVCFRWMWRWRGRFDGTFGSDHKWYRIILEDFFREKAIFITLLWGESQKLHRSEKTRRKNRTRRPNRNFQFPKVQKNRRIRPQPHTFQSASHSTKLQLLQPEKKRS